MDNDMTKEHSDMREALIIAGINELELHGLSDFSLRRVAAACGVSCAAPYRHFKNKDDLILSIISYINRRWSLLFEHICETYSHDAHRALIEVCVANIRFWIANPNFRSIMMLDDSSLDSLQLRERSKISDGVKELIHKYCNERGIGGDERERLTFGVRSILYGAMQMLGSGELENTPKEMKMIRLCLEDVIEVAKKD